MKENLSYAEYFVNVVNVVEVYLLHSHFIYCLQFNEILY